jgi:hypothetical protein
VRTTLRLCVALYACLCAAQVGKFYEIFNQDADVAIAALNGTPNALLYMKGDKAHCGFPEKVRVWPLRNRCWRDLRNCYW